MSDKTLTRADLVEAVVEKVGLPRHEAAELVETVLRELSTTLACGEPVKLSSFGSFGIREKRQRIGRNPKTGEEVPITPRRVLVFRASNIMKKRIDETIKTDRSKSNGKAKPRTKTKPKPKAKATTTTTAKAGKAKTSSKSTIKSTSRKTTTSTKSKKPVVKKTASKKTGRRSKSTG